MDDNLEALAMHDALLKALNDTCPKQLASVLDRGADPNGIIDMTGGNTALHMACMLDNSLPCVKLLVERGANINAENVKGQSPLHLASVKGHLNIVRLLIANSAIVNLQDKEGFTPLHMAAQYIRQARHRHRSFCSRPIIEILLNSGAQFTKNRAGHTALHYISGTHECVWNFLLERGVEDVLDSDGNTGLHYAIESAQNIKLVEKYLDKGISVNKQNRYSETALHRAARLKSGCPFIKMLVKRGADLNIEDYDGNTPLACAIRYNNEEVIIELINKGANINNKNMIGMTGIHMSVVENKEIIFNLLLEAGADANEVDSNGNTALHLTVIYKRENLLKRLLKTEIDVGLQNSVGILKYFGNKGIDKIKSAYLLLQRALYNDVSNSHIDMLQHKDVQLHHKNHHMLTALHLAAIHAYDIGVNMLLENEIKGKLGGRIGNAQVLFTQILKRDEISLQKLLKSDIHIMNAKDSAGRTALHWAVLMRWTDGVEQLLSKGVNINEQDGCGNTALHFAVCSDEAGQIFTKLLTSGADVNVQDQDKRTALHLSVLVDSHHKGRSWSWSPLMLLEAGALIDLQDCDGNTPLLLALEHIMPLEPFSNGMFHVRTLLNWGARTDLINYSGESCNLYFKSIHPSGLTYGEFLHTTSFLIRMILDNYTVGIMCSTEFESLYNDWIRNSTYTLKSIKRMYKEINDMVNLKIGRYRLYDVLTMKTDISFIFDVDLRLAIFSPCTRAKFPYYYDTLHAKFCRSEIRYQRLYKSIRLPLAVTLSNGSEIHMPEEVKIIIFSMLSDEDLVSVIKAVPVST